MNIVEEIKKKECLEIAAKLLEDKVEISIVCRATGLSEEEVTKLKKEKNL